MSTRVPLGWVDLVVAGNEPEAHLIAGILQEAGISSRLDGGRYTIGAGMYGVHNPMAPVAVMVEATDLEAARGVLSETDIAAPDIDAEGGQDVGMETTSSLPWRTIVRLVAALIVAIVILSFFIDNPVFDWR